MDVVLIVYFLSLFIDLGFNIVGCGYFMNIVGYWFCLGEGGDVKVVFFGGNVKV